MTAKAISMLADRKDKQGFFLMVEGGRIDHALHETTAKKALQDTVASRPSDQDRHRRDETTRSGSEKHLIVVTADHDHTLVLNGYAQRTGKTTASNPGVLGLVKNYSNGSVATDADGMPYSIIGFGKRKTASTATATPPR